MSEGLTAEEEDHLLVIARSIVAQVRSAAEYATFEREDREADELVIDDAINGTLGAILHFAEQDEAADLAHILHVKETLDKMPKRRPELRLVKKDPAPAD